MESLENTKKHAILEINAREILKLRQYLKFSQRNSIPHQYACILFLSEYLGQKFLTI